MRFALTKWYVDVVTDDGRAAIAYWASVRAAGVAHAVSGLLRASAEGRAERTFTLHGSSAPVWSGDRLRWTSPALGVSLEAQRVVGAFEHPLLETSSGALDWCCEAPLARVRIATASEVIEGDGYVERMELGVAPWTLPVTRIIWGRWTGPGRSLVWIRWEGPHPLQLVWLDGALLAGAVPTPEGVDLGARGSLSLQDNAVITDATVREQLRPLAPLRRLVDKVAHHRQTRWRARGTLRETGRDELTGWVIHEAVEWK